MARLRGTLTPADHASHVSQLAQLPAMLERDLRAEHSVEALAKHFIHASDFLYLGRGINYPVALEGALKLKEISYIHAEGYPAGEMKHGPIALTDEKMPVVTLAPNDAVYDKIASNIEQVKARMGIVIALATEGNRDLDGKADHVIPIPAAGEFITPILLVVPLQLTARQFRAWSPRAPCEGGDTRRRPERAVLLLQLRSSATPRPSAMRLTNAK